MEPPAPATFSTTNDCPSERPEFRGDGAADQIQPPPGWAGTMIFTGLAG